MKKKLLFGGIGAIILIVSAYFIFRKKESTADIFATVKKGNFEVIVTTSGELRAKNQVEITIPGNMRSIGIWQFKIADLVPEGTQVNAGDYVASLDKTEIMTKINESNLNVQKAEAELKKAQLDTTLTLRLARDELVNLKYAVEQKKLEKEQSKFEAPAILRNAEIEFEKAERNYDQNFQNYKTKVAQAKTQVAIIQSDLSKAMNNLQSLMDALNSLTITAPQNGMIIYYKDWDGKKRVVGSQISPWDPTVATLPDLSVMEVISYVSEIDIKKIKENLIVEIGLDSDPNKKLKGKIFSIASIGEQKPNNDAKVFEVVINVETRDSTLKPAMTTSNKIFCSSLKDVLYVPIEAVFKENNKEFVYVKDGSKTKKIEVKTGVSNETDIVIVSGLSENMQVYLSTPKNLNDIEEVLLPADSKNKQTKN